MKKYFIIFFSLVILGSTGCKSKTTEPDKGQPVVTDNYPEAIKNIIVNKCATSGCHNAASYEGAGGLLLDTWEHMFDGGNNGAVVVPYNPENSSLLYFVNSFPELGTTAEPLMPYNEDPLSKEEYITLRDWVANGCPSKNGDIPFASDPDTRQKIYMVQQGCDLLAVIDAEKQVVMRYNSVGKSYGTENPNNIVVSPDGKYAYISFWNTSYIQKIDTRTDSVIAELNTGKKFQKAIQISEDGTKLLACNWYTQDLVLIDAQNMQVIQNYGSNIQFAGGFASSSSSGSFYITSQFGNTLYKLTLDGNYTTHSIDGNTPTTKSSATTPDPYRVIMSKDNSKYFITCTNTHEVAVMDANTDTRIKAIPVGYNPQEMAISRTHSYLFVTCMNDTVTKTEVGSVYVIDYNTNEVVQKITNQFFQPYGIAVDDKTGLFYVFSRNEDKNGPPPHHSSPCDGRNGFYSVFDLNTLKPYTSKRFEVTVDPYDAATRFR